MDNSALILGLLGSSVLAALIGSITTLLTSRSDRAERKKLRDEEQERQEKKEKNELENNLIKMEEHIQHTDESIADLSQGLEKIESILNAIIYSNKLLMQDRIRFIAESSIKRGDITYERRKLLHDMWDAYHQDWKGNGDLNLIMEIVDELPLEVK